MFKYKKRIEALERKADVTNENLAYRCDKLQAQIHCQKGKHKYEFKEVGVGIGTEMRGEFGSRWIDYAEYRPAKVCKHCSNTINLKEEQDNA
jgi:hypothetical protein